MKKVVRFCFGLSLFLGGYVAQAQSFLTQSSSQDTVAAYYNGDDELLIYNMIRSATAAPVAVKWQVTNAFFGSKWRFGGFCDNYTCKTDSQQVISGTAYTSDPYTPAFGDFHVIFKGLQAAPFNTYAYIRAQVKDTVSGTTRNLVFVGYKSPQGVATGLVSQGDITVFPNPAREAVNVVFSEKAGVKTIAVYNLIGKVMNVYKPSDNGSARLDIDNLPSGVYFLRLTDARGHILATSRFTKQ